MALVKARDAESGFDNAVVTSSRVKDKNDSRVTGVAGKSLVNYACLRELCTIDGLGKLDEISSELAHYEFMQRYHEMFVKTVHRRPSRAAYDSLSKRSTHCSRACASASECSSQTSLLSSSQCATRPDSCSQLPRLRSTVVRQLPGNEEDVEKERTAARLMLLRKLLRKISVERTRDENHQIYSALKKLLSTTGLLADCEPEVLKGLCAVAQLDVWDEPGVAIDADSGFFMILSGAVKTSTLSLSESLAQHRRRAEQFSALLHDGFTLSTLVAGNSFGAVGEMGSINRRIRSAFTIEPCEILRITSSDHQRVMQKIQYKHEMEKLNILEGCKLLSDWSKQPLNSVAKLIKWSKFPSGVVVAKQGEMAKFLSIIKSGECRVLTHIVIPVTLPNCPQAKHRRMVEICRIGPFEMFGEASVLFSIPMTYTVVTSSAVELATLDSASISDLDQFTFQLFKQSSEKTSRQISQTEVEEEFARQQMKRSWEQLKLSVLSDSLRYCGIQPGVGKWKK